MLRSLYAVLGIPTQAIICIFIVAIVIIASGLLSEKVKDKRKFFLLVLLGMYLLIVFSATVFFRSAVQNGKIVAIPMWIYMEVMKGNPSVTSMDIVYNLFLLFPMGMLLAGIFPSIKVGHVLLLGLLISLGIETLQYLLCRGVSQLDDLVHNSIGCVTGWYISMKVFMRIKQTRK